jgi:hypothetical protein
MHRDTADVQLDKQGRIQIPKILLKYAKIKKEVKIIGYENRIELWDPKYLDEFIGVDENKYMQMAVDFTNPLPNEPTLPPTFTNPSPLSNVPSSLQINQSGGVQYNPGIPSNYPPPILIYHPGSYNQPPGYYPAYFQIPTIKPINNTGISSGTQEKPSSDASDPSTSIDKEKPKN